MAARLNETFCKNVKPPTDRHHLVYWDGAVDGFGLRVTRPGHKAFILKYSIGGQQKWFTIGQYPTDYTAEMARARVVQLKQGIREGRDPFSERDKVVQAAIEEKARSRTVADLCDAYMERHVLPYRRPKTAHEYQLQVEGHLLPQLGRFRVGSVVQADVSKLHTDLKATPYLANRVVSLVRAMFNWAKRNDPAWGINQNPAEGIERYHEEEHVRWLTEEEALRLARALDEYPRKAVAGLRCSQKQKEHVRGEAVRITNAIRLVLVTGVRRNNALRARWSDFDFEQGRWTIPHQTFKTVHTTHLPLSDQAVAFLRSLPREGAYLFPGRETGESLADIKTAWRKIREAAGLDDLRLQDLRHNYASVLLNLGEPLETVGALLGHRSLQSTRRYAHFQDAVLRKATNRAARVIPLTLKEIKDKNKKSAEVRRAVRQ